MISVKSDLSLFTLKMKTKDMAKEHSLEIEEVTSPRRVLKTHVMKQENGIALVRWGFFLDEVEKYRTEIRFKLFNENSDTKQQAIMAINHLMQLIQNHENSIKTAKCKEYKSVPNVGVVKCKDKKPLKKTIKPHYNLRSSQKVRKTYNI